VLAVQAHFCPSIHERSLDFRIKLWQFLQVYSLEKMPKSSKNFIASSIV
ncbi:6940_t:CDS:1, partial [Cetraspora pellucida]